jgi:hypothetical protein
MEHLHIARSAGYCEWEIDNTAGGSSSQCVGQALEFHSGQMQVVRPRGIGRCYAAKKDFFSERRNAVAALATVFTSAEILTLGARDKRLSDRKPT